MPRKTAAPKPEQKNQWMPEKNRVPIGGAADADTWEIPNQWLAVAGVVAVIVIAALLTWLWL